MSGQNQPVTNQYTVTFKDWDGTVLKTQTVNAGEDAVPPVIPTRDGYTFTGWSESYTNVTASITVCANYSESISGATFIVDSFSANAGETVDVTIRVKNNPGVAGAILTFTFDDHLSLISASPGEAFSELQLTKPGKFVSPCNFPWDSESGMATDDGVILTLQFKVSENVSSGDKLNIVCSYKIGDIYDENLDNVSFSIINGCITVK